MQAWHVNFSSEGRNPMFPEEALRRQVVRWIAATAPQELALFCFVDEHLHFVFFGDRERVWSRIRALSRGLRRLSVVPLGPAYIKRVEGRDHMRNLLDYLLGQPRKHGLPVHPALWTGNCFVDIIGARYLPGLRLRIRDALPRFRQRQAYCAVGLPVRRIQAPTAEQVRALGASRLVTAASAALAAPPSLAGRTAPEIEARRVVVGLGGEVGIPRREVAWALGITPRAARRLALRQASPEAFNAALLMLALEEAVHAAILADAARRDADARRGGSQPASAAI